MKLDKTDVSAMMEAVEMLRELGFAVTVISPDDLGVVSREQAETWMEDVKETCFEENDND